MTVEMEVKCEKKKKKTYIRKEGQERCPDPRGKNIRHVVLPQNRVAEYEPAA